MTRKDTKGKPTEKWADKEDNKDLKNICKGKKEPNGK